jgi:hypothetical protein
LLFQEINLYLNIPEHSSFSLPSRRYVAVSARDFSVEAWACSPRNADSWVSNHHNYLFWTTEMSNDAGKTNTAAKSMDDDEPDEWCVQLMFSLGGEAAV